MKKNRALNVMIITIVLISTLLIGCGANNARDRGRRVSQGPPPEAIEACEGKEAGTTVEFAGRKGESLKATCQDIDGQLIAVPEGMSPGGGRPQ